MFLHIWSGSGAHFLAAAQLSPPPHAGGREHRTAVDAEGRRPREPAMGVAGKGRHHHGETGPGTVSGHHLHIPYPLFILLIILKNIG